MVDLTDVSFAGSVQPWPPKWSTQEFTTPAGTHQIHDSLATEPGKLTSSEPFTFGQRTIASTIIQASSSSVETPTMITTQFGSSAEYQSGKLLSMAQAGIINIKTIGIAMNQTGMLRRHRKNEITRNARPANS